MSEDQVLKNRHPEIAKFLEQWRKKYEKRSFDLKNETDQADFYEAMVEITRHIAHTAQSVSLTSLLSVDGVNTVYMNVTPNRDPSAF